MARNERGPSFDERVTRAGLSPVQRETGAATLLLAEQVHELCDLIREQNDRIAEQTERLAEQNRLLTEIRDRQPAPVNIVASFATRGTAGKGAGGDEAVQIREPAVPPPDETTSGGPVAEPATGKTAARGASAKTSARAATPAKKTTTAARRSTGKNTSGG